MGLSSIHERRGALLGRHVVVHLLRGKVQNIGLLGWKSQEISQSRQSHEWRSPCNPVKSKSPLRRLNLSKNVGNCQDFPFETQKKRELSYQSQKREILRIFAFLSKTGRAFLEQEREHAAFWNFLSASLLEFLRFFL